MNSPATLETNAGVAERVEESNEHFEQPTGFGRLRWWFEESPMAFTASVALALVTIGFLFILTVRPSRAEMPMTAVVLQAVQAETPSTESLEPANSTEIERLSAAATAQAEQMETKVELPEVPRIEPTDPTELVGNQADSDKQIQETTAAVAQAGELLRKILEANQNREVNGGASGEGGQGAGQLDPNSTPGRQARWIITYPTLPQGEYERMLDSFRIELAYLMPDKRTMQYLAGISSAGRKTTGPAEREDRMFWYWVGQNRLRDLDEAILRKHGLDATSEVVHLYTKELEKRLAEMEREYLKRQFQTNDVERVAQTNFKIFSGGPGGWRLEVISLVLK